MNTTSKLGTLFASLTIKAATENKNDEKKKANTIPRKATIFVLEARFITLVAILSSLIDSIRYAGS